MTALRRTAAIAAVLTYALIVLGALVRATNSGLSCPDWPTCYGQWVLTPAEAAALPGIGYTYTQIMLEWVHRFIAGVLVGPLILAIAVLGWRQRRRDPNLPFYGYALVALLLIQASLGGITVLDRNSPWSVALHLGTALVLFAVLILVFDRARAEPRRTAAAPALWPLAVGVWLLALAAMASAAVTAKSGASLACATWPLCDGAVVPDLSDPLVRIHFAHRTLAAAVGIGLLALFALTRRHPAQGGVRGLATLALCLVAAQILLGALVIVLYVPVWTAVAHQALGVLTFAVISLITWRTLAAAAPAARRAGPAPEGLGHDVGLRRA